MTEQELISRLGIQTRSPVQIITPDWQSMNHYQVSVKRDDLIHPIISGNKWRKLKYALLAAVNAQTKHIVSFGGGFSNHLHALGYCCHKLNIEFTAIVRGDYSNNPSPMLQDLAKWQSNLRYVDRKTYQLRTDPVYLETVQLQHSNAMLIPEGGSWQHALQGVSEIITELAEQYDYILAPVGSGGTLAGMIAASSHSNTQIIGIGVLKGEGYLEKLVTELLPEKNARKSNWYINHNYHFGGYAKTDIRLNTFCQDFYQQTKIQIEPVYSGKLFFALNDLIKQQILRSGSKILALHTGGLQGARLQ